MGEVVTIVISASAGAVLMGLLFWRGYSVRATKLSLPFLQADVSKFTGLSATRFFDEVTVMAIRPASPPVSLVVAGQSPLVLIHCGWNIVCEAFVRRFEAYPDDEHIYGAASVIGGQNVEFVKMYRDIHTEAIRHSRQLTPEFAANYIVRAPSLAQRIEAVARPDIAPTAWSLIDSASAILTQPRGERAGTD